MTLRAACLGALALIGFAVSSARAQDTEPPRKTAQPGARAVAREIDRIFETLWKERGLTPSEQTTDAEFLRRIWLDLAGQIPPAEEARAFLEDDDPDKRAKKIEELLQSPLYAEHWSGVWENWLIKSELNRQLALGPRASYFRGGVLRKWLKTALAENRPYDRMVRELLTAEGTTDENGATAFLLRWENPGNMAIMSAQLFLGACMNCILYHNDTDWEEKDFYAMVAFFARVHQREIRGVARSRLAMELWEGRRGEIRLPNSGEIVPPKFLLGKTPPIDRRTNRREVFARLVTAPDNGDFPRALVNRMWAYFFARGFVVPLDAHFTVPATHPDVEDLLAKDFAAHGYDLKRVIRVITNTRVYQLSSRVPEGKRDTFHFSSAPLRPLSPSQLLYSLLEATAPARMRRGHPGPVRANPAIQRILRPSTWYPFMLLFDKTEVFEEGVDYPWSVKQSLFLMNSPFAKQLLSSPDGTVARAWRRHEKVRDGRARARARLEDLFFSALSRPPAEGETEAYLKAIDEMGDRRETYEDIFWALLNSSEFFFNH